MRLTYLLHSCFIIDDAVVTDPYHEGLGFCMPQVSASVVTLSHDHFDHNAKELVGGNPIVLTGNVDCQAAGMHFRSVATWHDQAYGSKRGQNHVFVIQTKECTVCHMGDIGEPCTPEIAKRIGKVDVLLVPVGGNYTVDAKEAKAYVDALLPRWVVPMHYRSERCTLDIATADKFLGLFAPQSVVVCNDNHADLAVDAGATQVLFFA